MPAKLTWQIFPVSDGHFRWVLVGGSSDHRNKIPQTLAHRLPSDPAHQEGSHRLFGNRSGGSARKRLDANEGEPSNLLESQDSNGAEKGCMPMFRTGSGKPVSVTKRSIEKARSLLEAEDRVPLFSIESRATSKLLECQEQVGGSDMPMFCTGSGKSVSVTKSSIEKAKSILGGGGNIDQVPSKLQEGHDQENVGGLRMFHTGLGRSVLVMKSSIDKARSALEEGDNIEGHGQNGSPLEHKESINGSGRGSMPMFHTGYGKPVSVTKRSIKKAMSVLDVEEPLFCIESRVSATLKSLQGHDQVGGNGIPMFCTGSGKSVSVRRSSIEKAKSILGGGGDIDQAPSKVYKGHNQEGVDGLPMFHTGLGRSVSVRKSSIDKARSVLEEGDNIDRDNVRRLEDSESKDNSFSMFRTGSGKSVSMKQSSLRKAITVLEQDATQIEVLKPPCCGTNDGDVPTFQTGSGKSVILKESSIRKAMAILQDGENLETDLLNAPRCGSNDIPMFQTGSGKLVSLKHSSIRKAMNILQDGENIETVKEKKFLEEAFKENISSVVKEQKDLEEASWFKEKNSFACFRQNASSHLEKVLPPVPKFTTPIKSVRNKSGAMKKQKKESGSLLQEYLPSSVPLTDISNSIDKNYENISILPDDKKRPWRRSSVSPFKRPRISRFTTPMNMMSTSFATDSTKPSTSEDHPCRTRVSTHYPFKFKRKCLEDFFGGPPTKTQPFGQVPLTLRNMTAENAGIYRFRDSFGSETIGPKAFQNMLLQSGAIASSATKEWVANHYKWIVWKLACLERCYPAIASGKLLTASNVLEELKYRYEREVNFGHRSAVRRILDGDASPASLMILCVSSIRSCSSPKVDTINDADDLLGDNGKNKSLHGPRSNQATRIELTDGWYSLDAVLDELLSKKLLAGKLFIGQKLRIWGAGLSGWGGPTSPLEAAKTVSLLIHMNGTYRVHWSSPLGFCKGLGAPLAFRCIKKSGGKVPRTLVGILRIYPVLFKERFQSGGSLVRSERLESKIHQLHNQRRINIAEEIMAEQHDEFVNSNDSEGATIYRILETSAEPDVLMADMSSEQLVSFSTYKAKQETVKQSCMQKKIEKALEDACLSSRDVTPFVRLRVVGLTSKNSSKKDQPREGLITIWDPTEKQKLDLVEGQMYTVSGLTPRNFNSNILHLQAKGSSTVWEPLASASKEYEKFFTARKAVNLSNLGDVPLASEFDIAAVVVHVGEVYISGCQKKQWVFLTDGSRYTSKILGEEPNSDQLEDCVLAVSFCSPMDDNDSAGLLFPKISGSVVAFYNLVKRAKDQMNHLWIAEGTENSTFSVCYNLPKGSHLKEAADSAKIWAKVSSSTIQKLGDRIMCIIHGHGS